MNLKLDIDFAVVVSDLHSGSSYGLMPSSFVTKEGQKIQPNAFQRWLLACWQDFWAFSYATVKGHKWAAIINGDAIEGIHHRSLEIVSPDILDHAQMAVNLLEPVAERADHIVMVEGTECHTNGSEHKIGDKLKAVKCIYGGGQEARAWPQVYLEVNGCEGVIRHHIGTTTRPYLEATQLGVQMNVDRLEAVRSGRPVPSFLISAHRHQYGQFDDGCGVSVVTPPWQGLTRHGRKVVPAARTQVGGVILDFRDAGPDEPPAVLRRIYRPRVGGRQ